MTGSTSLNARVGAVALGFVAAAYVALPPPDSGIAPLWIGVVAVSVFATWAFSDEMGLVRPLNRAGMVAFGMAALARINVLIGSDPIAGQRWLNLHAFAVLVALLLWSAAFLHRERRLKIAGAAGVAVSIAPIAFLIAGHVTVGVGGIYGFGSLFELSGARSDSGNPLATIDLIVATWMVMAAVALWIGLVRRGEHR